MKNIPVRKWLKIVIIIIILFILIKILLPFSPLIWRIIFPFLMAIVISYLLYPLLNKLIKSANMHRTSAIVVIFLTFFGSTTYFIYRSFPVFFQELLELSTQLPQLVVMYNVLISSLYDSTQFLPEGIQTQLDLLVVEMESTIEKYVQKLVDLFVNMFDYMISIFMIPIIVFYLLKDFPKICENILKFFPEKRKQIIERILLAIHEAFGTYIRGQLVLSTFIFLLTFLLYKLIDLKYSLLLSMFVGVMNIIPYFGPILGTIPAVLIAVTISWNVVIYVILIALFVQIVEGTLLSPYIMGKTANLHPILIIFILLVSSEIGGIIAMIIAIPSVMIVRSIFLKLYEQYTAMR